MVAVVAAVGGQVEGDGQAALAAGQVAAVEGVALFGRAKAGVLAHRPRAADVHGRVWPAQEGGQAGGVVEVGQVGRVLGGIERADVDLLHGAPEEIVARPAELGFQEVGVVVQFGPPIGQVVTGEIGLQVELGEVGVRHKLVRGR